VTTRTYTIDAANQRDALLDAARLARADGISPDRIAIESTEPLFNWNAKAPHSVRCIVSVRERDKGQG
jgi:hypothetical protein